MHNKPENSRPPYEEALKAWQSLLTKLSLPSELLWLFDENLCFEKDTAQPQGFRLGFQTVFTPPPPEAERIAYQHFLEFEAPLVWYRLGSAQGKSVCLLLCDPWFGSKGESEGFTKRSEWQMMFRPGGTQELEEVKDRQRWESRLVRDRPLHDLDFCMTLRGVHETLAHGRVLTAYERYALKLLHVWRPWLGDQHKAGRARAFGSGGRAPSRSIPSIISVRACYTRVIFRHDPGLENCGRTGFRAGDTGLAVKSWRYLGDPLFLLSSVLYVLNRWGIKPRVHSAFLHDHFDDLLLIPCALPPLLLLQRWLRLRSHDQVPSVGEIALYLAVWSILFEVIGPRIMPWTVGDPWDVMAYAAGAALAGLWWHRGELVQRLRLDEL